MMRAFLNVRWWLAGLVLLLIAVAASAPARLLAAVLPPGIIMEGFDGTLWSGRAARAQVLVNNKAFALGAVQWRLAPLSLFSLTPRLSVESVWGDQQLAGDIVLRGTDSLLLRDASGSIDARVTRNLAPLYVGGRFRFDIAAMEIRDARPVSMAGQLVWQDALWTSRQGDVPLGTYVLKLDGDDGVLAGDVLTLSGPLQVRGPVRLEGRRYKVDLALTGPATQNDGLQDSLRLMAVPVDTGYALALEGEL